MSIPLCESDVAHGRAVVHCADCGLLCAACDHEAHDLPEFAGHTCQPLCAFQKGCDQVATLHCATCQVQLCATCDAIVHKIGRFKAHDRAPCGVAASVSVVAVVRPSPTNASAAAASIQSSAAAAAAARSNPPVAAVAALDIYDPASSTESAQASSASVDAASAGYGHVGFAS